MEADGAPSALDVLGTIVVDMVVTDYALDTGRNGLDLLAEVRDRMPDIPRLLMTGYDLDAEALPGDRTAADSIISKPWDREALLTACDQLLS